MNRFLNIPNWITIARMLTVPIIVVLILFIDDSASPERLSMNRGFSFAAAILVTIAMASDLVDGYYARRYGLISTFGKFIDPLADKLIFLTAMIMMIPLHRLPAWIVVIFFVREVMVTALRGVAADTGIVIAASRAGKYKSAFVSTATVGLLLHYSFFGIEWRLMAWVLMVPAFVLSVASGLHYTVGFFRAMGRGVVASRS